MPSLLFDTDAYKRIEKQILELLDAQDDFLSQHTLGSTRATGDAVQEILGEQFRSLLGDLCSDYRATFPRRAMADLALTDRNGFYYVVDVKTHRIGTKFSMPNLTSVERLARFYEDDHNYFIVLLVGYSLAHSRIKFGKTSFAPIEWLDWDCLTLGALGWGQIQIADANRINVLEHNSRRAWMLDLCNIVLAFYPKEIAKIEDRMARFREVLAFWEAKAET